MESSRTTPNRLINETSPYLLQHAHNPVDWYPWGQEALNRARDEDRLILLSIGYSACHWCHVMERESFEDAVTARIMNDHFVCIKVDREERPDLDKVYQVAHQLLTRRPGGWPLTLFLLPEEHVPLFAGTYFPPEPRHGMPEFTEVLRRVAGHYRRHGTELESHVKAVREAFRNLNSGVPVAAGLLRPTVLAKARTELEQTYDAVNGGFGGAPKFPHPTNLQFLLRHAWEAKANDEEDSRALTMVRDTLAAMADGGIYDQVGGGFCRYSVDAQWVIPHFEKMLYDNAQLLPLYVDAHMATGASQFRRVARETADWVRREMQSSAGGYFSTLDADSEGQEGKFYVWTDDEFAEALDDAERTVAQMRYGLTERPNFEGKWHLRAHLPVADIVERSGRSVDAVEALLDSAREKLLARRDRRVRPGRDEKILTAWNGMMISGMAHAGRWLQDATYLDSAEEAYDFVRRNLWNNGRLLATTRDGRSHLNAYLDDYAWMIEATIALLQARWRDGDLAFAIELADAMLEHFEDRTHGGFHFTSDDHEPLLHRDKPTTDDAIPSGNGTAATVLQRLGHVLGEQRYLDAATRTLRALYPHVEQYPAAHGSLLVALAEHLRPPQTIVVRGPGRDLEPWIDATANDYAPHRVALAIPDDAGSLPGLLAERASTGKITGYICEGFTCRAPITNLDDFHRSLQTHRLY